MSRLQNSSSGSILTPDDKSKIFYIRLYASSIDIPPPTIISDYPEQQSHVSGPHPATSTLLTDDHPHYDPLIPKKLTTNLPTITTTTNNSRNNTNKLGHITSVAQIPFHELRVSGLSGIWISFIYSFSSSSKRLRFLSSYRPK